MISVLPVFAKNMASLPVLKFLETLKYLTNLKEFLKNSIE